MDYKIKLHKLIKSTDYNLSTPHFLNIYWVSKGDVTLLKNDIFEQYIAGDIFYVHDYEYTELISIDADLLCLSINNYHYINDIEQTMSNSTLLTTIHTLSMCNNQLGYEANNYKYALIKNVTIYIHNHIQDKLNCQQIAEIFFVNASFLSRTFTMIVGSTLSQYIVAAKIHFSNCSLLNGDTLEDVWKIYHFRTFQNYLQQFEKIKGYAPYQSFNK
ncbi:transcriptional regulator [Staphylococcus shinii]|uniref:transcriptional regulator n=1 Tax=Staphylococcus shinii TaxID=2912228 RepID=UPI00298F23D1|nr:transcriptional regulator [Staphylococcus shinii]MDW8567298.1 transcriptional regulator [Staphylococcus shinii]